MIIGTTEHGELRLDINRLVDTRMLIQANSGGGKSTLLRLLAERAAGTVPFIILDWEGEFITLRERVDVVLIGSDGEIATDARSAGLLARKLIELRASAVVDLGDLEPDQKREYVKRFLESLIHLPRPLWHSTIICVDEAHQFCPEQGKAASTQAVINLMSLGRKRGYCGILSTQRLSKIHKDAISECNNVFIGRTWLDVDQKRAGDTLGMAANDRAQLRDLKEGQFYAFGPALSSNGVVLVNADNAETKAPRTGERHKLDLPKASDAVREIVAHLADLPQQAEEEARTIEEAQAKIRELERKLKSRAPVVDEQAIERAVSAAVSARDREWRERSQAIEQSFAEAKGRIEQIAMLARLNGHATLPPTPKVSTPIVQVAPPRRAEPVRASARQSSGEVAQVSKCGRAVLSVLAQFPEGCRINKLAILAGYSVSGSFKTELSDLRARELIEGRNTEMMRITDAGRSFGPYPELPIGAALADYWLNHKALSKCQRAVMETLLASPDGLTLERLAEKTPKSEGESYSVSGSFKTELSGLRTIGILIGKNTETMRAADELL